jgi:AraC-like DNA-binding protein
VKSQESEGANTYSRTMTSQIKLYRRPEQDNGLIIIATGQLDLDLRVAGLPELDEKLNPIMETVFRIGPNHGAANSEFIDEIRKTLGAALKDGTTQLKDVARIFGIGPRTLERRLNKAGCDFKRLRDETRRQLAMDLLRDSQNKLTDIALRLGYSEVSAFNRAFKRWTNSTPLSFRRTQLRSTTE